MSDTTTISISKDQTFKSGLRDLVCGAIEAGGKSTLKNCTMTTSTGVKVTFDIVIEVNDVESVNAGETVMTAAQVKGA